jgi:hypothetical protein
MQSGEDRMSVAEGTLEEEGQRATAMLAGKVVRCVRRLRAQELLVEFTDGTRLFVDGGSPGTLELSITGGPD